MRFEVWATSLVSAHYPPHRWAANRPQPGRIRTDLNIASPRLYHLLENHRQLFGFSRHGSPHCQNARIVGGLCNLGVDPANKSTNPAFVNFRSLLAISAFSNPFGGKCFDAAKKRVRLGMRFPGGQRWDLTPLPGVPPHGLFYWSLSVNRPGNRGLFVYCILLIINNLRLVLR